MIAMSFASWFKDWLTLGSRSNDVIRELEEQRRRAAAVRMDMERAAGDQADRRTKMRATFHPEEADDGQKIKIPHRPEFKSSAG